MELTTPRYMFWMLDLTRFVAKSVMKFGTIKFFKICIIQLTISSGFCIGQNRIVFNNNAYMVLDNNGKVLIENSNSNAIQSLGSGGNIISENENDMIIWSIGSSVGSYVVPFTTRPIIQGGNSVKLPLTLSISSPGNSAGQIKFSTYETATDYNQPYPTGVSSMNQTNNSDGSQFTMDRFWIIDNSSYSTKPSASITFTYDESSNELGGSNLVLETDLVAQRWNSVLGSWESVSFGNVNTTSNTVSNVNVSPSDFWSTWVLQSVSVPLAIDLDYFTSSKSDCAFRMNWGITNLSDKVSFEVLKSKNGSDWVLVEKFEFDGADFLFKDENPYEEITYYQLISTDINGQVEIIETVAFLKDCENTLSSLYPNPTKGLFSISFPNGKRSAKASILDVSGKTLMSKDYESNLVDWNVEHLVSGTYYVLIEYDDQSTETLKLIRF